MRLSRNTRRIAVAALGVATLAIAVTGCSRGTSSEGSGDRITFFVSMGADTPQYDVIQKIVDDFEAETGHTVELSADTAAFDDQMKVKLASGDLPDVFATHGWSLLRYSPYLEPLTDQPWATSVNPSLDTVMRDENGDIYAFPGETDVAGILYNADVLEAAGVDPASLTTWDAFDAAAAAVAASGVTPIFASGKSQSAAGHIADYLTVDQYSDAEKEQLLDGTFVAEPYAQVLERVKSWQQNGWINKDYSSASQDDMARALATGITGFEFFPTSTLGQALKYNPDANLGFLPVPSATGQKPYLVGGEGIDSFGVSKTSEHKQTALDLIAFIAEPENAAALAESTASAPGLTTVSVGFGSLAPSYEAYVTGADAAPVQPYFDRVYLPSGAWSTLVATTDSVITEQSSVADAVAQLESQFSTLYGQNK